MPVKTLRNYINEVSGLRFIYENLKLNSGIGRNKLLNSVFLVKEFELKNAFGNLSETFDFVKDKKKSDCLTKSTHLLYEINDINATIKNLQMSRVLDDIELFEIKKFSLISQQINKLLQASGFYIIMLHDLTDVIDILDPEKTGIPSFYIYSEYDEELARLRKLKNNTNDPAASEKYRQECIDIEDKVRTDLSKKLTKFASLLSYNINQLANLDILIAKSVMAVEYGFCEPKISAEGTFYSGVFNPQIKEKLQQQNKDFQVIDIVINNNPTLITGANMSGKTVLLKTVALSQYLFQFGFFVPATKAEIKPVDEIILSVGDNQNEMNGLSSFAVEMLNINKIITEAKSGKKILALVDELARTTNPDEGKALVSAFAQMMTELKVSSLITTHYSGIKSGCRRLRVKGLKETAVTSKITVENINNFMDYSLEEVTDDKVPEEAIRIAEILGVDGELIEKTKGYL